MNFERGGDIKRNMDIGLKSYPSEGDKFLVRFKLDQRLAKNPELYPLRKLEKEGKPIVATCIGFASNTSVIVECQISGVSQNLFAYHDDHEWIIA